MIGLAVHHVVAQQIGTAPSALFDATAARLPEGPIPGLLRDFGARHDVTPEAFGWQLVQTAEGPDFMPAPYGATHMNMSRARQGPSEADPGAPSWT
jgi:hypothetical protein